MRISFEYWKNINNKLNYESEKLAIIQKVIINRFIKAKQSQGFNKWKQVSETQHLIAYNFCQLAHRNYNKAQNPSAKLQSAFTLWKELNRVHTTQVLHRVSI